MPFDTRQGVFPSREGRILDEGGTPIPGLYVAGWIKRGPTGIIGTNRLDSEETIARLIEDLPSLDAHRPGRSALSEHLRQTKLQVVSFDDWLAIERAEFDRGQARQKVAEKFVRVSEMLAICPSAAGAMADAQNV